MKMQYDNKVFNVINVIVDCFLLGLLFIVTSLPVFTMGASFTSLYYAMHKCVGQKQGYIFPTYMEAFKSNFKQATLTWLIYLALIAFLIVDILMFRSGLDGGGLNGALYYFFMILLAFISAWVMYLFPYISRFECTIKESMFKSFALMISNIGWSVLIIVIAYALIYICNDFQFLFLLLPGGFCFIVHYILEKIFVKYEG